MRRPGPQSRPRLTCALALVAALLAPPSARARAEQRAAPDSLAPLAAAEHEAPAGGAPAAPSPPATSLFLGSAGQIHVPARRASAPPVIDGRLDDAVWNEAAVLDSFTQSEPEEGVPDTLGTTCLVLYDRTHLYVGFRCHDSRAGVRAPLVPRDRTDEGDVIALAVDTFLDHQRSMVFGVNPRGVQFDGLNTDAADFDDAPDFQYESRGRVTADGWEAEMAIPFKSLRFPRRDTLSFGLEVARIVQRQDATLFWTVVRSEVSSFHSQFGTLEGLSGIAPGRNLQVAPYATTQAAGTRTAPDALRWAETERRGGVDLKYGLTSNLIADATVNPDFSQVEADAGVIDLNQRFALYFPEKRPFFLEGNDIFQSPLGVVYTRRIQDPRWGVKLTGKSGRTTLGVLEAPDQADGESVASLPDRANPYLDHDATYTIVRLKQDVLKSSYLGLLGGSREQRESYNRGAGVDGRLVLLDQVNLDFQAMGSWSRDRDFRRAVASLPPAEAAAVDDGVLARTGEITHGSAWTVRANRDSKAFEANAFVTDFSRHYAADMGFIPRTDILEWGGATEWRFYGGEQAWFSQVEPSLGLTRTFEDGGGSPAGRLLDESAEAEVRLVFNTASDLGVGAGRTFTYDQGVEFPDQWRGWVFGGSDYLRWFHGGASASWGDDVIFEEHVRARSVKGDLNAALRFTPQVRLELSGNALVLWRAEGNSKYAELWIPRAKLSWQISRELSLRWITELTSRRQFDTAGALTRRSHQVTVDALASWQLRPGSVVYLGYGSGLEGSALRDARPAESSLFAKVSWLWQL